MAKILDVKGLCFSYASREILRDVSFQLCAGESLVILGSSGVGKSTVLRLLAGLLEPSNGSIERFLSAEGVGTRLVFQEPRLFPWMSVRGNLNFALRSARVPKKRWLDRILPLLEDVGLEEYIDAPVRELSIGMAQRVALIRALVCQPQVLLLDEPFSALDPKRRSQLQSDVLRIRERMGVSVVMVTHDIREAIRMGSHILILHRQPATVLETFTVVDYDSHLLYEALSERMK